MGIDTISLRSRITEAVSNGLRPLPYVLAGWECGSIAFNLADEYSDIDLNFLLGDECSAESFYATVESALETVSPIIASHTQPPGRYFKLKDGGDYLLVDVCIVRIQDLTECLNVERHGKIRTLFDHGNWLQNDSPAEISQVANRAKRLEDHRVWFSISQSFVRKAILRGQHVEALAAYWGYTLKPLVELLRMRHCPIRWDFGMRYLDRDLPAPVYDELNRLMFIGKPDGLAEHLAQATAWAIQLLHELEEHGESSSKTG